VDSFCGPGIILLRKIKGLGLMIFLKASRPFVKKWKEYDDKSEI